MNNSTTEDSSSQIIFYLNESGPTAQAMELGSGESAASQDSSDNLLTDEPLNSPNPANRALSTIINDSLVNSPSSSNSSYSSPRLANLALLNFVSRNY